LGSVPGAMCQAISGRPCRDERGQWGVRQTRILNNKGTKKRRVLMRISRINANFLNCVTSNHLETSLFVPGSFPNNPKVKGMPIPIQGRSVKAITTTVMAADVCPLVVRGIGTRAATESPMIAANTNPTAIQIEMNTILLPCLTINGLFCSRSFFILENVKQVQIVCIPLGVRQNSSKFKLEYDFANKTNCFSNQYLPGTYIHGEGKTDISQVYASHRYINLDFIDFSGGFQNFVSHPIPFRG
jgi:hypothetical protein